MADQPSITAILAALAAQRPTATPQQQQAPYEQPQYQQAQNPYQTAPYSLPQPSSSGSLDLSNIKPVSSGTVSIADAIAKAKAIAAEKGVQNYDRPLSYGGSDPRLPQGGARPRQRSRSRSPVRRDNFRDNNYNPYRDERRGERQPQARDPYGRERSFSPNARGRGPPGTFSPPRAGVGANYGARDRSPPGRGGADDNVETLQIESNLVGLIIGRQGENLRRVEAETNCRVQFITGPDENGPYRQCKITGPRQRRAEAKAEINRIIEESGMGNAARTVPDRRDAAANRGGEPALRDGEDSMQIMVPDRTVGLIIGRGGETIRDLQERSGCHVNIVGENKSVNGLRPVNLIGSREAAAKAKDLIMEIVESDSKSQGSKERGPPTRGAQRDDAYSGGGGGIGGGGGYGGSAGGDKINDSIYVPSEAVGMIIGKGGETIKDMQNTTGCKINVSPSSGPGEVEREIGLVGSGPAIAAAKRAIEEKVDAVQQKNGGGGGGRRGPQRDLDYGDNSYHQQQSSYGGGSNQAAAAQAQAPAAANGEDPYAAYGGYQAYMLLWYQAMAAQQGGQGADPTKPPGTQ